MDIALAPEDIAFQEEARAWLMANKPTEPRPIDGKDAAAFDRAWQRTLFDGGWAGVHWPRQFGGRGLSGFHQAIWYEELARTGAPPYNNATFIALMHAGPTLIQCGSDAQKADHLPRILKGDSLWSQGFSEPGAGSDLANISTTGEIDGDHLVVNGQKMWTSIGLYSDYQELLVRVEPGSKRHHGLAWLICDMRTPGIEVRPIKIMTNENAVNMVYYDNVRIPLSNMVGKIGEGWKVAMSTLSFERGTGFIGDQLALLERVEAVIAMARKTRLETGRLAIEDDDIAYRLGRIKAETVAIRAMTLSTISEIERRGAPGAEASIMKLLMTTTYKALSEVAAEVMGWSFFEYGDHRSTNPWTYHFLYSWVLTIAGGSSEIQREIIADRILNLPRAR
ncbi:acyl-CoA dehydrogenase family protein [Sphingomonas flavalba]|uniref:acyl-CoA dehydrogenase family protein n=1 Tax=Sphingomonas flavalba TaxID=2559804 RepID=UPI0039E0F06D